MSGTTVYACRLCVYVRVHAVHVCECLCVSHHVCGVCTCSQKGQVMLSLHVTWLLALNPYTSPLPFTA